MQAENLVLTRDGTLKLIDLGSAMDLDHPEVAAPGLGTILSSASDSFGLRCASTLEAGVIRVLPEFEWRALVVLDPSFATEPAGFAPLETPQQSLSCMYVVLRTQSCPNKTLRRAQDERPASCAAP